MTLKHIGSRLNGNDFARMEHLGSAASLGAVNSPSQACQPPPPPQIYKGSHGLLWGAAVSHGLLWGAAVSHSSQHIDRVFSVTK